MSASESNDIPILCKKRQAASAPIAPRPSPTSHVSTRKAPKTFTPRDRANLHACIDKKRLNDNASGISQLFLFVLRVQYGTKRKRKKAPCTSTDVEESESQGSTVVQRKVFPGELPLRCGHLVLPVTHGKQAALRITLEPTQTYGTTV